MPGSGLQMRVAVAGGTGVVGRHVVSALVAAGHEPVVLARATGVDITTGSGLDAALAGAKALIDVSNVPTSRKGPSVAFFEASTGNLLRAGESAGVQHHVVLSIVGVDRVDFGYYYGKRRQEELVLASGRPVTVARATQFHEFVAQVLDRGVGLIAVAPRMLIQPIAAREVATELAGLVSQPPVGMAAEIAGPQQHQLPDLARALLTSRGSRRRLLTMRLPGSAGRAMATGGLLPTGSGPRGVQTFTDWLTDPSQPQ